jgi:hypothetical protein
LPVPALKDGVSWSKSDEVADGLIRSQTVQVSNQRLDAQAG